MSIKPPFPDLPTGTSGSGFRRSFSRIAPLFSKLMTGGLVKATCNDARREQAGIPAMTAQVPAE